MGNSLGGSIADLSWKKRVSANIKIESIHSEEQSVKWNTCCHAAAAVTSVVSDSVLPRRQQPTRLPRPWDSPGKNTGVGCHFLLHCIKVKSESEVTQSCPTLSDPMDSSLPGSSIHGIFQARVLEWGSIAFSLLYGTGNHIQHPVINQNGKKYEKDV